jgi:hypothetical protein
VCCVHLTIGIAGADFQSGSSVKNIELVDSVQSRAAIPAHEPSPELFTETEVPVRSDYAQGRLAAYPARKHAELSFKNSTCYPSISYRLFINEYFSYRYVPAI